MDILEYSSYQFQQTFAKKKQKTQRFKKILGSYKTQGEQLCCFLPGCGSIKSKEMGPF